MLKTVKHGSGIRTDPPPCFFKIPTFSRFFFWERPLDDIIIVLGYTKTCANACSFLRERRFWKKHCQRDRPSYPLDSIQPTMCQSLKPSGFYFVKKWMTANKGVLASRTTSEICSGFMFRNSLSLLQNLLSCLFRFLNLCKSEDSGWNDISSKLVTPLCCLIIFWVPGMSLAIFPKNLT